MGLEKELMIIILIIIASVFRSSCVLSTKNNADINIVFHTSVYTLLILIP